MEWTLILLFMTGTILGAITVHLGIKTGRSYRQGPQGPPGPMGVMGLPGPCVHDCDHPDTSDSIPTLRRIPTQEEGTWQ